MLLPASSILTPVWCINALLVFFIFCFLLFTPTWCMLVFLFYAWCVTASYCLHPYGALTRAGVLLILTGSYCLHPYGALTRAGFLLILDRFLLLTPVRCSNACWFSSYCACSYCLHPYGAVTRCSLLILHRPVRWIYMASIVYIVWCIDALLVFFLFHTTWCINVYTRMVHYRSWSSSYSPHILVHCHVFYTRMVQSILTPTCIPA